MAQPIPLEIPPRDPREELRTRLQQAPLAHAEALLDSYELLQQLHDDGVFELLRGGLSASDKLIETAVDAAKSDESVHAMRNAIILGKLLGSIDPEFLRSIAHAAGNTFGSANKTDNEPPGIFSLALRFRRKEVRRSIALLSSFLENLGRQFKSHGSGN